MCKGKRERERRRGVEGGGGIWGRGGFLKKVWCGMCFIGGGGRKWRVGKWSAIVGGIRLTVLFHLGSVFHFFFFFFWILKQALR